MSLPWIFETRLETVPQNIPYLFADQKRLSFWAERLKQYKGLKVGIAWQGNPHHQWDRHRSIELASFLDLGTIQGINLFSLQRGPGAEQIQKNSAGRVVQLLDPTARDSDGIMDVTAIMKCLDLVITVDTATAHLAGALGVTVWVLLSTMVDWRWLLMREDTPWYPSMRLFRQATRGNWSAVLERVSAELTKMSGVTDAVIR
jgi:ADP-heptose:LPS heptosyltransferase